MVQTIKKNYVHSYLEYLGTIIRIHKDNFGNGFYVNCQLDPTKSDTIVRICSQLDKMRSLIYHTQNSNVHISSGMQTGWLMHCQNIATNLPVLIYTITFKSYLKR